MKCVLGGKLKPIQSVVICSCDLVRNDGEGMGWRVGSIKVREGGEGLKGIVSDRE